MMIIIEAARSHSLFLGSPIVELPTTGDRARERLILEQVIVQFREIDKTRAVDRDFDSISISSSAITNSDFQHFYNRIIC